MQKKSLVILLILLGFAVCLHAIFSQKNWPATSSEETISTSSEANTRIKDSVNSGTLTIQFPRINYPISMLHDLAMEYPLAYPDPFSQNYPNQLQLPAPVLYTGNTLYFLSMEKTSFVGMENSAQTPESIVYTLYSYDFSSKQKKELGDIPLEGTTTGEFFFAGQNMYYSSLLSNTDNAVFHVREFSFATQNTKDILTEIDGNIFMSFGQTDSHLPVFMFKATTSGKNRQKIYLYDTSKSPRIIYDSIQEGLLSPEFSALAVQKDSIFLLKQTESSNVLETSLVQMDLSGNILKTFNLPDLDNYTDPFDFADKLYICDDFVFIKWFRCEEGNSYFSAYKIIEDRAEALPVPENAPCYLLTPQPVDNHYLLFSAFPDHMNYTTNSYTSHLYLFDMEEESFTGIHLPLGADVIFNEMVCNESGDLIMSILECFPDAKAISRLIEIPFHAYT